MGNALSIGSDQTRRHSKKLLFGRGNGLTMEDRVTVPLNPPLLVSIPRLCGSGDRILIREAVIYDHNIHTLIDPNEQRYECVIGRIDGYPNVAIPLIVKKVDGGKTYTPLEQHPAFYR